MSNLLEQWNEHVVKGNLLSRELEDFDDIMHVAEMKDSKIAFSHNCSMTTFIDPVLSPDIMDALKTLTVLHLTNTKTAKETELKKHMNSWKPATINPEFEAAVQEMEKSHGYIEANKIIKEILASDLVEQKVSNILDKQEPDPVEQKLSGILQEEAKKIEDKHSDYPIMTKEDVGRMYLEEGKTVKDIAEHYGVKKEKVTSFLQSNHLFRNRYKKDDGFLDKQVEERQKQSGREKA